MKKPPGRPAKRRVTATAQLGSCVSTRLSSISFNLQYMQRETFPCPKDPDLLRLIARALVFRLGRVNKKSGDEAQRELLILAMREAMSDKVYNEGLYSGDFDKRSIDSALYADPTIKDLIKRLAEGKSSRTTHDPELLKFQRELMLDYIDISEASTERKEIPFPKYQKDPDTASELMQKWVDKHLPILIPTLTVLSCACGYRRVSEAIVLPPPTNESGDATGHTKRDYLLGYSKNKVMLALLAHLHGVSSGRMDNLLKKHLSSAHPPLLT